MYIICKYQENYFILNFSKESLPRSEAVAQLAAQIAEKYDWAATDKRQIKEQLLCEKNTTGNDKVNHVRNVLHLVLLEDKHKCFTGVSEHFCYLIFL